MTIPPVPLGRIIENRLIELAVLSDGLHPPDPDDWWVGFQHKHKDLAYAVDALIARGASRGADAREMGGALEALRAPVETVRGDNVGLREPARNSASSPGRNAGVAAFPNVHPSGFDMRSGSALGQT